MRNNQYDPARDIAKLQSAFSQVLLRWYRKNHRDLPWRRTKDPYAILVSEIMLQQTQVKTVIPYYERWMSKYPTIESLAVAPESEVLKLWEGLGYYRRVRLLHSAAQKIIHEFNGKIPRSIDQIATLPGVGRYTLGAVASIAFNLPMPILDGNVVRVLCRWFGIYKNPRETTTREELWKIAEALIPAKSAGDFNQSLMELGATVCLPQKPLCSLCPIHNGCWALPSSEQGRLPSAAPRPVMIEQFEYAGLVIRKGRVLLSQRSKGERMEHLWQLPSITLSQSSKKWMQLWEKKFGSFRHSVKLHQLNYSVTHHRIHLRLFKVSDFNGCKDTLTRWMPLSSCKELTFTAAHRKLVNRFLNS